MPTYQIEVFSSLYQDGTDEDGEEITSEAFYLTATAADGRRWAHDHQFRSNRGRQYHQDMIAQAEKLAAKVTAAQAAGTWTGPTNSHWFEVQPCYGSEAYGKNWRAYAAQDDLADGNFEPNTAREFELLNRASVV